MKKTVLFLTGILLCSANLNGMEDEYAERMQMAYKQVEQDLSQPNRDILSLNEWRFRHPLTSVLTLPLATLLLARKKHPFRSIGLFGASFFATCEIFCCLESFEHNLRHRMNNEAYDRERQADHEEQFTFWKNLQKKEREATLLGKYFPTEAELKTSYAELTADEKFRFVLDLCDYFKSQGQQEPYRIEKHLKELTK